MTISNPLQAADPSCNAIVKASAGVGKTYLLVTRLIRLLLQDCAPDSILAITFTRKAAAEMQTRLVERLYELAIADKEKVQILLSSIGICVDEHLLAKAQALYEFILHSPRQIRTTTFHSFCQDILQKFPLEADVPPGFELLDENSTYQQIAWDILYDEATQNPDSKISKSLETLFDLTGGLDNTRNALNNFLEQRADWWAFTFVGADPVTYAIELLVKSLNYDPDEDIYCDLINAEQQRHMYRIIELWDQHRTDTISKQISSLQTILESIAFNHPAASSEIKDTVLNELYSVFYNTSGNVRENKFNKTRAKKIGDDAESELLELFSSIANKIAAIKQKRNIEFNIKLNSAWYIAGNRLVDIYQQIKQEQRLLDFTDLEWKTFVLLNHADNALWVQYKLDERIRHLLIDEFQDTNPTQWRLLLPIMQEFEYNTEQARSVFIVGDEKQSIYSFRRADPLLLHQASDWIQQHLGGAEYPMDKSRRSAPQIINLVNSVFSSDGFKKVLPSFSIHATHLDKMPGWIRLLPLVVEEVHEEETLYFRNPLTQPRVDNQDIFYQEGKLIAETINNLIKHKHIIADNGNHRQINYGDIMLLIRSRKHVKQYEKALRQASIPYISNNKGTLFACQEIQDMIALLTVLHSPFNDIALATLLRSPLFNCSNEDLLLFHQDKKSHSWFEILMADTAILSEKLLLARNCIFRWRLASDLLPIHDMLDKIYHEANVMQSYADLFPPHLVSRAQNNLSHLLSLALQIDSGRYPSLGRFLAKLENLRQVDASPDEAANSEDNNGVRILTIHASKGLEAPVVFLADTCDNKSNSGKHYQTIVQWPQDKTSPTAFRLCPIKEYYDQSMIDLLDTIEKKAQTEDANLLYVALTRARQAIYISGTSKDCKSKGWYQFIEDSWPGDNEGDVPSAIEECKSETIKSTSTECLPLLFQKQETPPLGPAITPDDTQSRGIIIHRALELLSGDIKVDKKACINQLFNENNSIEPDTIKQYCDEADAVVRNPLFQSYFDPHYFLTAYNEIPLQTFSENNAQQGIIDRLVVTDKTCFIIDYKTHTDLNPNDLNFVAQSYRKQLNFYAQLVQDIWPSKKVKPVIIFTHFSHAVEL